MGGAVGVTSKRDVETSLFVDEPPGGTLVIRLGVVDVEARLLRIVTHVPPHRMQLTVRTDVDRGEELDSIGVVGIEAQRRFPVLPLVQRPQQVDIAVICRLVTWLRGGRDVDLIIWSDGELRECRAPPAKERVAGSEVDLAEDTGLNGLPKGAPAVF